jgi:fatty acid desaturase
MVQALGVAGILAWLLWCGVSLPAYLLGCVIPSIALLRLRAFAEHRYADTPEHRTAVVEGSRVLGLLFLFNNLHAVHHRWPAVPWYRLPDLYALNRKAVLARNGGLCYRGYGEVFRRFLLHPHDEVIHPGSLAPSPAQASTG